MTPEAPFLPLVLLKPLEEDITWEEFESDPRLLFAAFAKFYAVKGNTINDNIVKSDYPPTSKDRGKIWCKTSFPYAIGAFIDGEYRMDYSISGYPVNTPFLHERFDPKVEYISEIDATSLSDYGITDTKQDAKKRMYWHIFEPPSINV